MLFSQTKTLKNVATNKKPKHPNQYPADYYAGFWIRFWAFLIDVFLIACMKGLIFTWLARFNLPMENPYVNFIGGSCIYLAYFILLTRYNDGQTIGKMIFGIKVVSFTEKELTWSTILIREGVMRFIFSVNPLFLLGYLVCAFTPDKTHIGDFFAQTGVVTLKMIRQPKKYHLAKQVKYEQTNI